MGLSIISRDSHATYAACTTTGMGLSCWPTGSTSANAAARCATSSSTPDTTTRMRQPIRNQMRAPLPQGDRAGVDLTGGLRHGRDGVRGNTWMMAVELGVTIQVLNDYRQLLYDSGVCVQ